MSDDTDDEFMVMHHCEHGTRGISRRDGLAELRPMRDGQQVQPGQSVVEIAERHDDGTLKLRTLYTRRGPARTSSPQYRDGFEATFGNRGVN